MPSSDIQIRTATEADLPRLKELTAEAFEGITIYHILEKRYGQLGGKPWQEWKTAHLGALVKEHPEQILVAEADGEIVGFCTYHVDRVRGVGEVGNNGVDRRYRNRGIGTRLYSRAIERLREEGMRGVEVVTGLDDDYASARRAYEKVGFQPLVRSIRYILDL
jgi:ribosomal protein S18 acetylase RimI-like enzyme